MACLSLHVAIAKKYLENHKELDYKDVINGTIYPDSIEDDSELHYTNLNRGSDLLSHLEGKVNLYAFLEEHQDLNDFEIGWFLHLITDYLFFEECFKKEYLSNKTYEEFCNELYHAYSYVNLYVEEKYNVSKNDFKDYPNEYWSGIPYEECILPKSTVDNFIEHVSKINLEDYIKNIKENKKNVKPLY